MSKYLETKKGSLEDMVAGVTKGKQSEDYKQLFKKELEKAGKGIGAMSDQEKKAFFNNIDKKHKAKNEGDPISKKMNQRQKNTPGEGTGAAVVDNPRRMKDLVHKESVELDESVKVEGGPPADGGPGPVLIIMASLQVQVLKNQVCQVHYEIKMANHLWVN